MGAGVKCAALLGADLLVDQNQADLLLILHDALVGIVQGLDELLVGTTGGVMDEKVPLELELLKDLGIIMNDLWKDLISLAQLTTCLSSSDKD